jgi:methylenetetrahydrofolate reductase (NADPH)
MPVTNFNGLKRMSAACGAAVPDWLAAHFEGLDDDPETRKLIAASVAAETCARLQEEGFADFHFYTLNRADLVYAICRVLGVREGQSSPIGGGVGKADVGGSPLHHPSGGPPPPAGEEYA